MTQDLDRDYFDRMYDRSDDPWEFDTRWYEERKRALTLAMLPRRRFRRAFEPGCATGLLTQALSRRCDEVVATDVSARALQISRERTSTMSHVRVVDWALGPERWPVRDVDLLVLSEVGYYLSAARLRATLDVARTVLAADAVVVAVHWRHPVADYPMAGDEVQRVVRETVGFHPFAAYLDADVSADVLTTTRNARSVATEEGLS